MEWSTEKVPGAFWGECIKVFASLDRIILKPAADKNLLNMIVMANLKLNGENEDEEQYVQLCESRHF